MYTLSCTCTVQEAAAQQLHRPRPLRGEDQPGRGEMGGRKGRHIPHISLKNIFR